MPEYLNLTILNSLEYRWLKDWIEQQTLQDYTENQICEMWRMVRAFRNELGKVNHFEAWYSQKGYGHDEETQSIVPQDYYEGCLEAYHLGRNDALGVSLSVDGPTDGKSEGV
jgi:hypothetical protein